MQRPAELVPIPWSGVKASEGFGKLRKVAAFWKNPENIWSKFSKIQQNSGKICKIFVKNQQKFQQILTKKLRFENGAKGAKECIV